MLGIVWQQAHLLAAWVELGLLFFLLALLAALAVAYPGKDSNGAEMHEDWQPSGARNRILQWCRTLSGTSYASRGVSVYGPPKEQWA